MSDTADAVVIGGIALIVLGELERPAGYAELRGAIGQVLAADVPGYQLDPALFDRAVAFYRGRGLLEVTGAGDTAQLAAAI